MHLDIKKWPKYHQSHVFFIEIFWDHLPWRICSMRGLRGASRILNLKRHPELMQHFIKPWETLSPGPSWGLGWSQQSYRWARRSLWMPNDFSIWGRSLLQLSGYLFRKGLWELKGGTRTSHTLMLRHPSSEADGGLFPVPCPACSPFKSPLPTSCDNRLPPPSTHLPFPITVYFQCKQALWKPASLCKAAENHTVWLKAPAFRRRILIFHLSIEIFFSSLLHL